MWSRPVKATERYLRLGHWHSTSCGRGMLDMTAMWAEESRLTRVEGSSLRSR